jgi:transposase
MPFATKNPAFLLPQFAPDTGRLPDNLPDDVSALKALLYAQQAAHDIAILTAVKSAEATMASAIEAAVDAAVEAAVSTVKREAQEHLHRMIEQLVLARHRQFGSSSEQSSTQTRLFDEAETLAQSSTDAQDLAPIPASAATAPADKKPRGKRAPLPAELERIEIVHDVPEDERTCPCGTAMVEIGQDISEQLDIVPMQIRVLRHIRKRYGCAGSMHAPVSAALPPQPLPKTNASADFLAMLLTVKFVDGQPISRFAKVLERFHAPVPEQTLGRWVIGSATVLQPLLNLARDSLLAGPFIHIDETVVQVLKEKDKAPTSQSYMWVQAGGLPEKPVVIFDYDPSRSGRVPVRLLHDYRGYLMTDAYDGYSQLAQTEGIERLVCWAHVRRRFVEAVKVQPKGKRGRADDAVDLIRKLYRIESEHKDVTPALRLQARRELSLPALAKIHAWLDKTQPAVAPKSALGTALTYLRNCWPMLIRYTERGDLPIDNNRCENAIRPFVIGRKAWLFSDTVAGANSSAIIYSLVETAKANGLEPYLWLRRVLRELPTAKTVEKIEALLPWNCRSQQLIEN